MGHERVGILPRSQQWRALVAQIGPAATSDEDLVRIAAGTLKNVRSRFDRIHKDLGVQAAFGFLIGLSTSHIAAHTPGRANPPIQLDEDPSPLKLTAALSDWIGKHAQSLEYAELAKRAAADAMAFWTRSRSRQRDLFSTELKASQVWRYASTGAGFSEVSRAFFAKFVERYLKYFLEREASAQLGSLQDREEFSQRLEEQIDALSHHAFETSKIAQSFAAGWFNKYARDRRPTDQEIEDFLAFAFGKLRQELQREATL